MDKFMMCQGNIFLKSCKEKADLCLGKFLCEYIFVFFFSFQTDSCDIILASEN